MATSFVPRGVRRVAFMAAVIVAISGLSLADAKGDPNLSMTENAIAGFSENLGSVPAELLVKDIYPKVVHQGIGGFLNKLLFKLGSMTVYRQPAAVADVIMMELERALFGADKANQASWKIMKLAYHRLMREWWTTSPHEPFSAIQVGVWKTLTQLNENHLSTLLSGTPAARVMNNLITDPSLETIKQWTDAAHIHAMHLSSHKERRKALDKLWQQKQKEVEEKTPESEENEEDQVEGAGETGATA